MSELKEEKRRMRYLWFPRARSFDNPVITNNYDGTSTTSLKKEYSIGLFLPDDGFCSAAIGENISDEKITSRSRILDHHTFFTTASCTCDNSNLYKRTRGSIATNQTTEFNWFPANVPEGSWKELRKHGQDLRYWIESFLVKD